MVKLTVHCSVNAIQALCALQANSYFDLLPDFLNPSQLCCAMFKRCPAVNNNKNCTAKCGTSDA